MPNCDPPIETRFPVNRKDHTKKGPYLVPLLRKLLEKKITFEDPETRKMIEGTVKDALMWRLVLNGTQGDHQALKEILDRVDGKVAQELIGQGFSGDTKIIIVRSQPKEIPIERITDKT
jgi:hypothetical protein